MNEVVLHYDNGIVAVVNRDIVEIQTISMYGANFADGHLDETDFIWTVPFENVVDKSTSELYDEFKLVTECSLQFVDFSLLLQRIRVSYTVLTHPKY